MTNKMIETKEHLYELDIIDFTDMGQGVAKVPANLNDPLAGETVFVNGAFPGDRARVRILKNKKSYALGEVAELVTLSPDRVEATCPMAAECGGCTYRGLSYKAQTAIKAKQVKDKLKRLAGIDFPHVCPIIAAGENEEKYYRNKAEFAIGKDGSVGFYSPKSHRVVDCTTCELQMPPAMAAASALRAYIKEARPSIYDAKTGKGVLRGMVVKCAAGTGEVMVIIIATEEQLPHAQRLADLLDDEIYNAAPVDGIEEWSLESIVINVNKKSGGELLGDKCVTLAGKNTILETTQDLKPGESNRGTGPMKFEISPLAFYQVNPKAMMKLYSKALEYAKLSGNETVFDLYCGVGTIGLFAAKWMQAKAGSKAGCVYGIESVKGAVLDANRNAVINGIVNARYLCGKAEEEIFKLTQGYTDRFGEEQPPVHPDVVILDPPRAGCDQRLLEAVAEASPKRIVYVSCDPGTLARDVRVLATLGFTLSEATPVEMFPYTSHCETVCLLSKK